MWLVILFERSNYSDNHLSSGFKHIKKFTTNGKFYNNDDGGDGDGGCDGDGGDEG